MMLMNALEALDVGEVQPLLERKKNRKINLLTQELMLKSIGFVHYRTALG